MKTDITLVTCARLVAEPDRDDVILREALVARGKRVAIVAWDDATFDWSATRIALIRSTWDYYERRDAFVAWAERAGKATRLFNPPDVIRWNTHKGYLVELAAKDVPVTPTELVRRGAAPDLPSLLASRGWKRVVVKPAVSAGSNLTMLVHEGNLSEAQRHLETILEERGDVLVQPYMSVVEEYGERSMIVVDGELTHAVRKRPAFGKAGPGVAAAFVPGEPILDNAEVDEAMPAEDEAATARRILAAAGKDVLYARVDLVRDEKGAPTLMELELVEPSLFLWHSDAARDRLVDALIARAG